MSLQHNYIALAGNLTRDPQVRFLPNDQSVANFGLAINRRYKAANGEMRDDVTFVDIEAWGKLADLVGKYFTKGRPAFIEGRLKLESWTDKDGNKRSRLKIVADQVRFVESKGDHADAPSAPATTAPEPAPAATPAAGPSPRPTDDEPPF